MIKPIMFLPLVAVNLLIISDTAMAQSLGRKDLNPAVKYEVLTGVGALGTDTPGAGLFKSEDKVDCITNCDDEVVKKANEELEVEPIITNEGKTLF